MMYGTTIYGKTFNYAYVSNCLALWQGPQPLTLWPMTQSSLIKLESRLPRIELSLDFSAKRGISAAAAPVCMQAGRNKLALKPSFVTWILQRADLSMAVS